MSTASSYLDFSPEFSPPAEGTPAIDGGTPHTAKMSSRFILESSIRSSCAGSAAVFVKSTGPRMIVVRLAASGASLSARNSRTSDWYCSSGITPSFGDTMPASRPPVPRM